MNEMNNEVIITCAVTGGGDTADKSPHVPVTPEQIADQVVFLASTRGRTISGQAISVCGDTQMLA